MTTVSAWSFLISALNICLTETVFISAVDFSLTKMQVRIVKTTKMIATASANHLKPISSTVLASAFAPPNALPRNWTAIIVTMVMIALPTPAQERASVVRPSRSLPPSVNAGIIDQYGMSIIV